MSHPTPPGPVLHSGTIDSFAAVACDGSPIDVYSPPILSGRLVPSQVMIGIEKVTGMQIVRPSMLHAARITSQGETVFRARHASRAVDPLRHAVEAADERLERSVEERPLEFQFL